MEIELIVAVDVILDHKYNNDIIQMLKMIYNLMSITQKLPENVKIKTLYFITFY